MRCPNVLVVAVAGCLLAGAAVPQAASQFPWFGGGKTKFKTLDTAAVPFSVDYPDKNWQAVPGGGGSVTLAQNKGEATVVVDRQILNDAPLRPDEINEALTQSEMRRIGRNHPNATGYQSRIEALDGRRILIIEFSSPGLKADEVERVRQYMIPIGINLFRVTCRAKPDLFPNYEATFQRMAGSVQPATGGKRAK